MNRRLSEYSIDELLLMSKAKFLKLLQKTIEEIRLILDPDGEFAEELKGGNKSTK